MRKIFEEFQAKKVAEWSGSRFALAGVTNQIAKTVPLTDVELFLTLT
jgi:hypothetical protein